MKPWLAIIILFLQSIAVEALPLGIAERLDILTDLDVRSPANPLANALNGAKGAGLGGNQKSSVTGAASSFASDVGVVSASLNGMGNTTDTSQVRQLARKAYVAEKDEDQHRAVLNGAAGGSAIQANQKIVDNTPIVLNGLQAIMVNPSAANTMRSLQAIEGARNKNILPSITQLSNSAFQQAGVNQQAKTFQPTTGAKNLAQLQSKEES